MRSVAIKLLYFSICQILINTFYLTSYAQPNNNFIGDVVMPPPEISSLGKYTEIGVDLSTGVPQISIPIHVVKEGMLSLPISLNYHASGIKAGEGSSWVGTGWTLMAGGMISRTVMGLPDEWQYGFWNTGHKLYDDSYCTPVQFGTYIHASLKEKIANNLQDGEPDIFSFNVPGYSGKFYYEIINGELEVVLVPQENIKIEKITTGGVGSEAIKGFKLTTPDGVKYWFGEKNGNSAISQQEFIFSTGWDVISSAWHLVKIETHDGIFSININYQYDNTESVYRGSRYDSYYSHTGGLPIQNWNTVSGYEVFPLRNYGFQVHSIVTSTEEITFDASQSREDTAPFLGSLGNNGVLGRKLDVISIESGEYRKKYEFFYDYFEESLGTSIYHEKRLKLLSLQESNWDGSIVNPPYLFYYNGNFLPSLLTKAIDHWGFYNSSEENNISTAINIPPTTLSYGNGGDIVRTLGEANRNSDEEAMKMGVLKKIEFPTAGYTEYHFEGNSYWENSEKCVIEEVANFYRYGCTTPYPCYGGFTSDQFIFTGLNDWKFFLEINMCDPSYPPIIDPPHVIFQLLNTNGEVIESKIFLIVTDCVAE